MSRSFLNSGTLIVKNSQNENIQQSFVDKIKLKLGLYFSVNKNTGRGRRRRRRRQSAQYRAFFSAPQSAAILDFDRLEEILQTLEGEAQCGSGYSGFLLWMEEIMFF